MDSKHLDQRKPDIRYPCDWEYKVIGADQEKLKTVILAACAPNVPSISLSNVSSKGTYYSLDVVIEVENEERRLAIFEWLQNSPDVKIVI